MSLKHTGRDVSDKELRLTKSIGRNSIFLEDLEDGSVNVWNEKTLKPGCGYETDEVQFAWGGLIYCPHCDEWFNEKQWEVVDEK